MHESLMEFKIFAELAAQALQHLHQQYLVVHGQVVTQALQP